MSRVGFGFRGRLSRLLVVVLGLLGAFGPCAGVAMAVDDQAPQVVPTGLMRVFGAPNVNLDPFNASLDVDGVDDKRLNVDIAVLDSGIDLGHPDLNVVGGTDCTAAEAPGYACSSAAPDAGDDGDGHGTNSALRVAAIDNGIGRVGAAAGARLWAVDIHDDATFGSDVSIDLEAAIAGLRWVAAHADQIEVAHLALGCAPEQVGPSPQPFCRLDGSPNLATLEADLDAAVDAALDAGVVVIDGAGNWNRNVNTLVPQRLDEDLLLVSGVVDTDGLPGSLGPAAPACNGASDDHSWGGNWGALVDVASPGCATSVATPQVSAAAAILASRDNPANRTDVREIADTIVGDSDCAINSPDTTPNVGAGNCDWTDDSSDGVKEPLLDVGDEGVFDPVVLGRQTPPAMSSPLESSNLSATTFGDALNIYARRGDGNLFQVSYGPTSGWSQWYGLGGPSGQPITSGSGAVRHYDAVNVYARGSDGGIWQKACCFGPEGWTGWFGLGGPGGNAVTSAPAAVQHYNSVNVYARGSDGGIWQKACCFGPEGWTGWFGLGGPGGNAVTSAPAAVQHYNSVNVYARGSDGGIWQKACCFGPEGWTGWWGIGSPGNGQVTSSPAAVVWDNRVYVFVRGADGDLWQRGCCYGPNGWWDWRRVTSPDGDVIASQPTAVVYEGQLHLFVRDDQGGVHHAVGAEPTSWSLIADP